MVQVNQKDCSWSCVEAAVLLHSHGPKAAPDDRFLGWRSALSLRLPVEPEKTVKSRQFIPTEAQYLAVIEASTESLCLENVKKWTILHL